MRVRGLVLIPGKTLSFGAVGHEAYGPGYPLFGPDGDSALFVNDPSLNGISGYNAPVDALVGVFLTDSEPINNPAPPSLDFGPTGIGTDFPTLAPALQQIFFIGDGLTGTGTGTRQTFVVPSGATRLYLGVVDGFGWSNNIGSFIVAIE